MLSQQDSQVPVATELLVATFSADSTITFRNDAWQKLLGNDADIWADLPDEDQLMVQRNLQEAAAGSLVTNQIFFVPIENRPDPLPILLHFIPVFARPDDKKDSRACVTVTGEVMAEPESWVQSQTQRNRVENVGRMTLGLVHEINNMLTNILGNFEIVEKSGFYPDKGTDLNTYLNTIRKAANDGAAMTRSIKQYIRNEKSSAFELIDITALLEDSIAFTRPYWQNEPRRQGILIKTESSFQTHASILGSVVELKEVFINLITNAVQAMPEGGLLKFATYNEGDDVIVSIADTGTGMSEKTSKRIFEPLFTTKGKQGTGLGLSLCYSIIENHQATISVDTALNKGTTFTIRFRKEQETTTSKEKQVHVNQTQLAHILAVDDEPGVRNVLANLLTLSGHSVTVAASGQEALTQLQKAPVDIVFTDYGMPGMNGRQLAQAIRAQNAQLPIVLVTGDTDFAEQPDEINAIIGKPFMLDDLQQVINDLVHSKKP